MTKRLCTAFLILALLFALTAPAFAADLVFEPEFLPPFGTELLVSNAKTLVAISTDLRTEKDEPEAGEDLLTNAGFSVTSPDLSAARSGPFRVQTAASGNTLTQIERPQEQLEPLGRLPRARARRAAAQTAGTHAPGDTFDLKSVYWAKNDETGESSLMALTDSKMICRYVGTHCTVWGSTSDHDNIRLNTTDAILIGRAFDEEFDDMTAAFGDFWYDVDGDGKLAIMCYDIDGEYAVGKPYYGGFTAGYYSMADQITVVTDGKGKTSNILDTTYFSGVFPNNAIDCIRIDTYPLMGKEEPLSEVEACYSTLIHEFQHMLNNNRAVHNYSTHLTDGLYYMPTYLNEAFSMAAEHLIFGSESTADRLKYRHDKKFSVGQSLTCWTGGSGTLSQYSNSYLLGQYFRTRYAQQKNDDTDGSAFFKKLLDERQYETNGDTLAYIAELLGASDKQSLICDFWAAVYCNQPSGLYGFAGEAWAKELYTPFSVLEARNENIYNGGATAYSLDIKTLYQLSDITNLTFIAIPDVRSNGLCGETMKWEVANNAGGFSLMLDGTGAVTSAPWQDYAGQITDIRIPVEATAFPADAFAGCTALENVFYTGSKADWDALRAALPANSPLKAARITYLDDSVIANSRITADSISITVRNTETTAFAAAAYRKNGQFLRCDFLPAGAHDDTLSMAGSAVADLRLLQLADGCKPLAAPISFPLN